MYGAIVVGVRTSVWSPARLHSSQFAACLSVDRQIATCVFSRHGAGAYVCLDQPTSAGVFARVVRLWAVGLSDAVHLANMVKFARDAAGAAGLAAKDSVQVCGSTALARRVPLVRPNSDIGVFQRCVIERNALVKVIDRLSEQRELAPKVWEAIENGLMATASEEEKKMAGEASFSARVLRIEKLDKEWIAQFLVSSCAKLTQSMCDEIDGADENGLLKVFCCALSLSLQTLLPSECRHKGTCWRLMKMRYSEKGSRLDSFAGAVKSGVIDWTKWRRSGC